MKKATSENRLQDTNEIKRYCKTNNSNFAKGEKNK